MYIPHTISNCEVLDTWNTIKYRHDIDDTFNRWYDTYNIDNTINDQQLQIPIFNPWFEKNAQPKKGCMGNGFHEHETH